MDENIKKYLYNINEESLTIVAEMLANADAKLCEAEINKIKGPISNSPMIDTAKLAELYMTQGKDATDKYILENKKINNSAMKDLDISIAIAKANFRQIAIVFDTMKIIVNNRQNL